MAVMIRPAQVGDVDGICAVCSSAYRVTYAGLLSPAVIEQIIVDFYAPERVRNEIEAAPPAWLGYQVAMDGGSVVGAAGGGMIAPGVGELFVLYLDPQRKREGIGTRLLDAVTDQLRTEGATEMWVSVGKGNMMGIPFYEATGFELRGEVPAYGVDPEGGHVSLRMRRAL
jgi:ribosomal protein S18 acetylase RimI-like enzyme